MTRATDSPGDHQAEAIETARLESLGRLAHRVAHDSNNLLMVVLGHADLILATAEAPDSKSWPSVRDDADQVCSASRTAGDLMRQLLDYARAGGEEVGPVRLDRLVKEMGNLLRVAVPKSIALTIEIEPVPATIQARIAEIRQLFTQLALNAVDSMAGDGGQITVKLRVGAAGDSARPAPRVEVTGIDGPSVEPRGNPLPFATRRPGALGRGQAMADLLARRNDGALQVDRPEGGGYRVTVTFPGR